MYVSTCTKRVKDRLPSPCFLLSPRLLYLVWESQRKYRTWNLGAHLTRSQQEYCSTIYKDS